MIDERWSPDAADVAATLRELLEHRCDESTVRQAEEQPDGRSPELEKHLDDFGLFELPNEPELLTIAAVELGRALAPVPFVETTTARVVLDRLDTAYAPRGLMSVGVSTGAVPTTGGVLIVPRRDERTERTGGGEVVSILDAADGQFLPGRESVDRMFRVARLLSAARMVGASRRLLEIGVQYAGERHAFGKPIGSYQGVSHKLADVATAVEGAELLLRKAAWVADEAQGGDGAPSMAFAVMTWSTAVDAGRLTARHVHQAMGGFGATLEFPTQLYSRRIRSWALRLGRPSDEMAELGRALLDPVRRDAISHLWHHDQGLPLPRWAREIDATASTAS